MEDQSENFEQVLINPERLEVTKSKRHVSLYETPLRMQELEDTEYFEDRRVLVIGSGENSAFWNKKGAQTLDIDPNVDAEIVGDANKLSNISEVKEMGEIDTVVVEYVDRDPEGNKGVDLVSFVPQVYAILSEGGEIFILSASIVDLQFDDRIIGPREREMMEVLASAGFNEVVSYYGRLV